jgi:SAM-dependent methyltransferase
MEAATITANTGEAEENIGSGARQGALPERDFRFYDNRQKYLLFVNTCSEKSAVADRIAQELPGLRPTPPALRVFDAGVGDGTVLTRVMRWMHQRFPTLPFYVVGKEISLEDVRLTLEKLPDRFFEHPATVLVLTNLYYKEAPWLAPHAVAAASSLVWREVALTGGTARDFEAQITALQPFLAENWRVAVHPASGNPMYVRPAVLVIYREDHRFQLSRILPQRAAPRADFDLVIASQPYRLRAPLEFKASRVIAPLAKSLAPGGRLVAVHSRGGDPGLEIVRGIWPDENPFVHDRHQMLKATREALGGDARGLMFNGQPDRRSLFRYAMHALPSEVDETIGTSTVFAAWNAAIYVNQIEDARLDPVLGSRRYLDVTREVLRKHGGLWFWDESYRITRRRE